MSRSPESVLLSRVLTFFGLFFVVALPILNRVWPSGWAWQPEQPAYLHMILSIYVHVGCVPPACRPRPGAASQPDLVYRVVKPGPRYRHGDPLRDRPRSDGPSLG